MWSDDIELYCNIIELIYIYTVIIMNSLFREKHEKNIFILPETSSQESISLEK